jgi:spore maturation protein CgeB
MKLVIFGLTVSSSWGNGHATLWRGLCKALARRGHKVVFFERDVPYYAQHRDLYELPPPGELILYSDWSDAAAAGARHLADADTAMVTSYCPDGVAASELILEYASAQHVFYDLDTPVTLMRWERGEPLAYLGPRGLADFDLVLSFTGGRSIEGLRQKLGARRVAPLYGSVDPEVHQPAPAQERYRAAIGYLGTYAADREASLRNLFVEPARRQPHSRFLLAGAQYDDAFPWQPNIFFIPHLPPAEHSAFYCSTRLTLNITRESMAQIGYCPSGRLFEATACGAAVLSDSWEGLDQFFQAGSEVLLARETADAMAALERTEEELARMARTARERTLAEHTATVRAGQLERLLWESSAGRQEQLAEAI